MVGDHRKLGAVGPGGGIESLVARYGAAAHVLADNVQRDVAERAALADCATARGGKAASAGVQSSCSQVHSSSVKMWLSFPAYMLATAPLSMTNTRVRPRSPGSRAR